MQSRITSPTLATVDDVATLLNCSVRHVQRLSDSGRMPSPVRLGRSLRWSVAAIQEWIEAGCPDSRKRGAK